MKTRQYLLIVSIIICLIACSKDNPDDSASGDIAMQETWYINFKSGYSQQGLKLADAGNRKYHLIQHPSFLEFETLHGSFQDGQAVLKFTPRKPEWNTSSGYYSGLIVLHVEKLGLFGYPVIAGDFENQNSSLSIQPPDSPLP